MDVDRSARDRHLFEPGRKRILALDGGGVRGAASIAFLEELERRIAVIEGRPTRLCDWFDLIGGTSTGAIIATALALGLGASDIRELYTRLATSIFDRSRFRMVGWQAKFDSRPLIRELRNIIGDRTLDSADLQTGLCVVLKRMDTGSAWIVMNNPRSQFWESPADGSFIGNRHLRLADVVRASTAAPSFFDPELIEVVPGAPPGLFIDGGLTPHNNPALLLLMTALLPAYGLEWQPGPERMMIVSVGTGSFRPTMSPEEARKSSALTLALRSLAAMISESQTLVLTLMSYLGQSPVSWPINSEVGNLGALTAPGGDLFRFLRYDLRLEPGWLSEKLGIHLAPERITALRRMDDPTNMAALYELARQVAPTQIVTEDLRFSDVAAASS